jgi:hypothetical protein
MQVIANIQRCAMPYEQLRSIQATHRCGEVQWGEPVQRRPCGVGTEVDQQLTGGCPA